MSNPHMHARLKEIDTKDKLLVYWGTGKKYESCGILRENGFSNIYHMVDDIEAWGCWISQGLMTAAIRARTDEKRRRFLDAVSTLYQPENENTDKKT
jgi:hypothetical protein